ncbi:MAG: isoprenylcysteine carboxylmethyltransferase family protein [Acidobacteria bacterium]|nr:isoprenylcysteine carboxylmethyltransferase family protein [Acidobacteriota bacterium]
MKYVLNTSIAGLLIVGAYHRIRAARSGEPINRRYEGLPLLIGIRLSGLAIVVAAWLAPSVEPSPSAWAGAAGFLLSVLWLAWMFISPGRNLTGTVVTRRDAFFVSHGPYRFVRNPMYTGVLAAGLSLALTLGSWPVAVSTTVCFTLLAIRTRIEERFLLARFGSTYQDYMNQVGRFLPRLI